VRDAWTLPGAERLLRALPETNALVASARDAETGARIVAEQLIALLGAAAVVVCVPATDFGMRVVYAARADAWEPRPGLPSALRLCELAWRRGQSIGQATGSDADGVQSAGAVPLWVGDRVVATVCVGWARAHADTARLLELVALIGTPFGAALEVLELARQVERQSRLMAAMSEFLCRDVRAAHDEEGVEDLAVKLAMRALRAQSAAVWLLKADESVRYAAGVGYRRLPDGRVAPVNDRLVHVASVELVNLPDASMEPVARLSQAERQVRFAYLAAPIRRNGVSLGVLEVLGERDRRFDLEEEQLLSGLASGMAIGVTSAREAWELDQEEQRLAAVVEQLPSGVLVLDPKGHPLLVNSACRRILGRQLERSRPIAEQATDLDLREAGGERRVPIGSLLRRVLAGEEIHAYEATFRPAGSASLYWLQASAVPLRDPADAIAGAVVVVTDVTRERRLAGDLASTVRQNHYLHGALAERERRLEDLIAHLLRPHDPRGSTAGDGQIDALTPREREVLGLLGEGKTNLDIARDLQLSVGTVRLHVKHVLSKLGVTSRTQAALRAHALARSVQ